ncbi:MAG: aminotransferase class III-fold pyridoxal phosphate-dependent enzyme [Bacteroidota bacterium]
MDEQFLFENHIAQTRHSIFKIRVSKAKGIYIYDENGRRYIDFISGISVSSLGHGHPEIIKAVKKQAENYTHVMVYGEYIQSPQVKLAGMLADLLPEKLQVCFFVNSGSEAVEGAIKLAMRYTGRKEVVVFKNSYHGSTICATTLLSERKYRTTGTPGFPVKHIDFNSINSIEKIDKKTACVILEPIQTAGGIIPAKIEFLEKLRAKCNETGTLLVFDEIQTGMGRTGRMFAYENFNVVPDILVLAKAFGGGMPLGAFISSRKIMDSFDGDHPLLGHATTFGGHPVSCAAASAAISLISNECFLDDVRKKAAFLLENLSEISPGFQIRETGMLLAIDFENAQLAGMVVKAAIQRGLLLNTFLFNDKSIMIAPPLTISMDEISAASCILKETIKSCLPI